MGNYAAEMVFAILKQSFMLLYTLVRLIFGLGVGVARTRQYTKGYTPTRLGQPLPALMVVYQAYDIRLPKDTAWDADKALRFVTQLIGQGRCMLQIVAERHNIAFRIVFLDTVSEEMALATIYATFPDSQVTSHPYYLSEQQRTFPFTRLSLFFVPQFIFPAPIFTVDLVKHFDPLVSLTEIMSQLDGEERVIYTIAVLDEAIGAAEVGYKQITMSDIHPLAYTDVQGAILAEARKSKGFDRIPLFEGNIQSVLEDKLTHPLFHCMVTLQTEAPSEARARDLAKIIGAQFVLFANNPFNFLDMPPEKSNELPPIDLQTIKDASYLPVGDLATYLFVWLNPGHLQTTPQFERLWKRLLCVLMPQEIAALWHLPHADFTSTAIDWITSKQVPLPKPLRDHTQGVLLGENWFGGRRYPVYLPDDDRTAHAVIIGKTGTGKSSLLHHMIQADIAANRGVCVIDPHGTLVQSLLRHSIPDNRTRDVVVLDIANRMDGVHYPPPFNLLSRPNSVEGDVATGMVMSVLTKIYDGFGETQMAHTLSMALTTLNKAANPTLLDVARLFDDADFRDELVAKLDNLSVRRFWSSFLSKSPAQQEQMTYPMLRRLDGFYNNNALLAMTCHPEPLNLVELLRQKKIILISLAADESRIPTLERLLVGSMLVSQLQMAAMAGAIRQPPFLLYIDEAQHFVTTALSKMLSEARKHGLGLILANQYLRQLTGDTLDAVMGTIGTLIAFEVGEPDSHAVATYMKPEFNAQSLVALGKYRAAVSLRVNAGRQPAFSLETLPPPQVQRNGNPQQREADLRQQSIATYTPKPYSEVMNWLNLRYAPDMTSSQPTDRTGTDDEFIEPKP